MNGIAPLECWKGMGGGEDVSHGEILMKMLGTATWLEHLAGKNSLCTIKSIKF